MKVWSLRWNTLSDRSILPEMICQEKNQLPSKIGQTQGIGTAKAAQIKAALEVDKRMAAKTSGKK